MQKPSKLFTQLISLLLSVYMLNSVKELVMTMYFIIFFFMDACRASSVIASKHRMLSITATVLFKVP